MNFHTGSDNSSSGRVKTLFLEEGDEVDDSGKILDPLSSEALASDNPFDDGNRASGKPPPPIEDHGQLDRSLHASLSSTSEDTVIAAETAKSGQGIGMKKFHRNTVRNGNGRPESIALRSASVSSENSLMGHSNNRRNLNGPEQSTHFNEELDDDDLTDFGESVDEPTFNSRDYSPYSSPSLFKEKLDAFIESSKSVMSKYVQFIGPGIMVSVAYMDPGNYSTAVSAGALYRYKHLFVILVSNLFAVFLQILCVKLGSVTGLDLAQNCRKHLPRWLCIVIYILAEIAIIATDLAEVVGTAIALNILVKIPLPVGVTLTIIDVLLVLMAYRPNGPLNIVRYFEYLVSFLVFLVVVCFAIELGNIDGISSREVFKGFLPSADLTEEQGLYLSCGILGATVMPHSLYLGSGLVQPRLKDYDVKHGFYSPPIDENTGLEASNNEEPYKPSLNAIKYSMSYSIAELVISLFTVAIFVNSAILIVAGATLFGKPGAVDADLFSIYDMLKEFLGSAAATVFALALLFSGQSAGIVCTLAGQMVSEGFLHWSFQPWIRRLITRALAILPCLFVSIMVGQKGLADVLNASQVVLSLLLPIVTAPLLYFTASKAIMSVPVQEVARDDIDEPSPNHSRSELHRASDRVGDYSQLSSRPTAGDAIVYKDMSNSKATNITAACIFGLVTALNCFLIMSMLLGADVHL